MEKPTIKSEINIEKVIELCKEYVDYTFDENKYHEGSMYPENIGYEMMCAVFGDDVMDILFEKGEQISESRRTGKFLN